MNIKKFIKDYAMFIALIAVFILFAVLTNGRLLVPQNLSNLLLQNAYVIIMACGMLLCILTGGNVDLAAGSTLCLVASVAAILLDKGVSAITVIIICLILSVLVGAFQGFLIGKMHIPAFICTLSGMFLFRGIARMLLESKTVAIHNQTFFDIFTAYINIPGLDDGNFKWSAFIFGIVASVFLIIQKVIDCYLQKKNNYELTPALNDYFTTFLFISLILVYTYQIAKFRGLSVTVLWIGLIVIVYEFLTSRTATGRHFYAVGGNQNAAKLSGIDIGKVFFFAYTSMSLMAGLSGLIVVARTGSINGDMGSSFAMDAIGACFIGGASASGGSGKISGVIIGAALLGIINQGMSILGLDNNFQYIVKGVVLLAAVMFDVYSQHKSNK